MAKRQHSDHANRQQRTPQTRTEGTRDQPAQPTPTEQSGSAGRQTGDGTGADGKDSGQGRYGQSGLGGKQNRETAGQTRYQRSGPDGSEQSKVKSNRGSGRPESEAQELEQRKDVKP